MIAAIYWCGVAAVLWLHITVIALFASRYIPLPAIARTGGILALCLTLFSVEHYVGLGDLRILFLPLTGGALYLAWRWRDRLLEPGFKRSQWVFLGALAYGVLWRLPFPEIIESGDRLSDIRLVANYFAGTRLPPVDGWLPWQVVDYYYAFPQYSAALMGRFIGLGPGASFNLAAILLAALVITLGWEFLSAFALSRPAKLLAIASLAIGGTGVSPLFHLIAVPPVADSAYAAARNAVFYNSRFVGWFEDPVASPLWHALRPGHEPRSVLLPIETFGYHYVAGGYHAPLAGFLLLFLALAIMVWIPRLPAAMRPRLEGLLGLSVALTLCSHAWVLPLQGALVGAWKLWERPRPFLASLRWLAAGFAVGVLLLLPFLAGLGAEAGHMHVMRLPRYVHTPVFQFAIVYWPLLLLAALIPLAGLTRSLSALVAGLFVVMLLLMEVFNVYDGAYGGEFIRFNPALKWWGWIFSGGMFAISAALLASPIRLVRAATAIVLVLVATFAYDAGRWFVLRPKLYAGKLDGTGFYVSSPANARMLEYLTLAPPGIVLEKVYEERPLDTGIYGSFALKPNLVGISWVSDVWKRGITEIPRLDDAVKRFYAGTLPDSLRFLTENDVRYVVWSVRESDDLAHWSTIMSALESGYRWVEFAKEPDQHVGLWIRR